MTLLTLQPTAQECIDCAEKATDGNWHSALACFVTLAITAVIRHIEKKRIEKRHKK
jgi:hypothetical protein